MLLIGLKEVNFQVHKKIIYDNIIYILIIIILVFVYVLLVLRLLEKGIRGKEKEINIINKKNKQKKY